MKRAISVLLIAVIAISLCACGANQTAPDTAQAAPTAATAAAVPVTEAAEPVAELLIREDYHFVQSRDDVYYGLFLTLYPRSSQCVFSIGNQWAPLLSGTYTEDGSGMITVSGEGGNVRLRRDTTGLVLEEGSLAAYAYMTDDPYGTDPIALKPGDILETTENVFLQAGIYVLDDSQSSVSYDEVLLELDLTQMGFALRCFDGNVVRGDLEIRDGLAYCRFEGGCIAFDIVGQGTDTTLYVCYPEDVGQSYLMYCPQTEFHYAHQFRYAPDRTDGIGSSSGSDFFENRKTTAVSRYCFSCFAEGADHAYCSVQLEHLGITDTWTLINGAQYIPLEAAENPDGTLLLSAGEKQWQFHWENNGLIFDGGSPLEASGELSDGVPKYTVPLKSGDCFAPDSFHHLYDTCYVVPGEDGSPRAILMLDTAYQRLRIRCSDGSMLEAPYTVSAAGLTFPMGTHSSRLTFGGHSLHASNPHHLTIVEGSDDFWFIPSLDTEAPEEEFRFKINPPAAQTVPENSILVFEDFTAVVEYPGMVAVGELLLCPHEGSFTVNTEFSSYYAQGTYEESGDGILLTHGGETTKLHREEKAVVIDGGSPLCISGMPFTSAAFIRQALAEGTHIPLYRQGWLYNGTYAFSSEAGAGSVTFDTQNRTFTLTDSRGTVYEGSFLLDFKFVICDAGSRRFRFIPYGNQVRLDQSDGDKVVPVENDYLFFDFIK